MSLLPMLFSNWWENLERPHRLFDQHFGLALSSEDLPTSALAPYEPDIVVLRPCRYGLQRYQPYEKVLDCKSSEASVVQADKNEFHVTLDVQQFAPEEITVKVVGQNVVVEGKHEERQDEHGWISRQFVRKYLVSEQCDVDQLKSSLSSDGVLTIIAPRKEEPELKSNNKRIIKIRILKQPTLGDESSTVEKPKENPAEKNSAPERGQEKTVKAA